VGAQLWHPCTESIPRQTVCYVRLLGNFLHPALGIIGRRRASIVRPFRTCFNLRRRGTLSRHLGADDIQNFSNRPVGPRRRRGHSTFRRSAPTPPSVRRLVPRMQFLSSSVLRCPCLLTEGPSWLWHMVHFPWIPSPYLESLRCLGHNCIASQPHIKFALNLSPKPICKGASPPGEKGVPD
jgi:hypothetical protein